MKQVRRCFNGSGYLLLFFLWVNIFVIVVAAGVVVENDSENQQQQQQKIESNNYINILNMNQAINNTIQHNTTQHNTTHNENIIYGEILDFSLSFSFFVFCVLVRRKSVDDETM